MGYDKGRGPIYKLWNNSVIDHLNLFGVFYLMDYIFYANTLPGIAPTINVQEEESKCHLPEDPIMYESVELVDCDTSAHNIFQHVM